MAIWSRYTRDFLPQETTLYETYMQADKWGYKADWRPDFTSKNRLKVSNLSTQFYNTFQYQKEDETWVESVANGASGTFDTTENVIRMAVTGDAGSKIIRQTKIVMSYIPGRQQFLSMAVRYQYPQPGIRRRIGLFDENNGFFFEDYGGVYSCVVRKNGVETERIARDDWNGDKLDGNGKSGITANPEAQQLIAMEYEWYGAGAIKFGYVIDDEWHIVHTIQNANHTIGTWSKTPFLPIRLELENVTGETSGNHYLWQCSSSVTAEGTPELLGFSHNATSNIAGKTMQSSNTFYPILSLRINPSELNTVIIPQHFQAATVDNTNIFYRIIRNGTLTGANWVFPESINTGAQIDRSATEITGGDYITAGFIVAGNSYDVKLNFGASYQLGRIGIPASDSEIFTIACASNNTNKSAIASLTWLEQG